MLAMQLLSGRIGRFLEVQRNEHLLFQDIVLVAEDERDSSIDRMSLFSNSNYWPGDDFPVVERQQRCTLGRIRESNFKIKALTNPRATTTDYSCHIQ